MTTQKKVLVIAGPTASGKSEVALTLAQRLNGEIVNADSVQVYRGFDIGSAKPSRDQQNQVPHRLIDLLNPDQFIDAAQYAQHADAAICEIEARGKLPIVVGGTGLWLRALLRGLVDAPAANPAIRARLEAEIELEGGEAVYRRLAEVDPLAAASIHPNDSVRVIRALEVYEQTGVALGELRQAHALGAPRYKSLFIILELDKDRLQEKIEKRFEAMLARGWLDEIRMLLDTWGPSVRAFGSVGYRQLCDFVQETTDWENARRAALSATRVYARRQRNWFASEPGVDWIIDAPTLVEAQSEKRILTWLNQ